MATTLPRVALDDTFSCDFLLRFLIIGHSTEIWTAVMMVERIWLGHVRMHYDAFRCTGIPSLRPCTVSSNFCKQSDALNERWRGFSLNVSFLWHRYFRDSQRAIFFVIRCFFQYWLWRPLMRNMHSTFYFFSIIFVSGSFSDWHNLVPGDGVWTTTRLHERFRKTSRHPAAGEMTSILDHSFSNPSHLHWNTYSPLIKAHLNVPAVSGE